MIIGLLNMVYIVLKKNWKEIFKMIYLWIKFLKLKKIYGYIIFYIINLQLNIKGFRIY